MSDQTDQPRRRRRQPAPPPPTQGSVARGAVLVAIAVVIGIVLLRNDDSPVIQAAVGTDISDSVTPDDGDAGGDAADPTAISTSTVPSRPPSQVKVLVANGSGVNGAAGAQTDGLEALGYVTATPTNAERVPATIVYYSTGYEAEAVDLAEAIGAPPTAVALLPAVAPVDDMQLANLLIVLGPDLAGGGEG